MTITTHIGLPTDLGDVRFDELHAAYQHLVETKAALCRARQWVLAARTGQRVEAILDEVDRREGIES